MKRYLSLDVFRGMTVALMILVNNPGSWSTIFPPLRHAAWEGCTPCDLVFPFFLFCVGVSMAFSLSKFTSLSWEASRKVLKRGVLLYVVGLLLTAFPFYPYRMDPDLTVWQNYAQWLGELRLVGILARIAMCYVIASILALWLQTPKKIWGAIAVLSITHVGLLLAFAGPEGAFSLEGNFGRRLDIAILGEGHVYHGYSNAEGVPVPFDPEGIFGALTGSCTALIGYLVGKMIRKNSDPSLQHSLVARMYTFSAVALAGAMLLSIWIPICKPLWSVSYVFYTAGWAMFVMAFLMYLIDIKGVTKPFFPFQALGMNPLAMFVLSGLVAKSLPRFLHWDSAAVFGANEWMSLLYAVLFMLFHLLIAVILYRKKIFIKL